MIRKMKPEDRELYIEMAHDFYHSSAVLHAIPDAYIEKAFAECMNGGTYAEAYILEYENKPAGYGLIAKTFSQEAGGLVCWIEEVYVKKEYRSKGLGREFFAYMEQTKGEAFARFRLEAEADNTRAIELYKSLGYKPLNYRQMIKEPI